MQTIFNITPHIYQHFKRISKFNKNVKGETKNRKTPLIFNLKLYRLYEKSAFTFTFSDSVR